MLSLHSKVCKLFHCCLKKMLSLYFDMDKVDFGLCVLRNAACCKRQCLEKKKPNKIFVFFIFVTQKNVKNRIYLTYIFREGK